MVGSRDVDGGGSAMVNDDGFVWGGLSVLMGFRVLI
jgi:hypothetical protein